ncbi:MAG: hypothetical protein IPG22_02755 [Acidobacteria bacterium]|nr:hypothetical protein [Acidobacteriota bacterium]
MDDDEFTELPKTKAFGFTPKLVFYLNDKTTLTVGNSFSYQDRKGGDVLALRGKPNALHTYFEENKSLRNVTTFNLDHQFADGSRFLRSRVCRLQPEAFHAELRI